MDLTTSQDDIYSTKSWITQNTESSIIPTNNEVTFRNIKFTAERKEVKVEYDNSLSTGTVRIQPQDKIIKIITNSATSVEFDNCFFGWDTGTSASTDNIVICKHVDNSWTQWSADNWISWVTDDWNPRINKRRKLRQQMAPAILNHHGKIARSADKGNKFNHAQPEELVALQLLRKMVTPDIFKKYLKHHFVTVQGQSGLVYQIRRGRSHIKVWKNGTLVCELCVHLKDYNIPPTDAVVAKMVIVECDEIDIWRRANVYWKKALEEFRSLNSKTIKELHLQLVA